MAYIAGGPVTPSALAGCYPTGGSDRRTRRGRPSGQVEQTCLAGAKPSVAFVTPEQPGGLTFAASCRDL